MTRKPEPPTDRLDFRVVVVGDEDAKQYVSDALYAYGARRTATVRKLHAVKDEPESLTASGDQS